MNLPAVQKHAEGTNERPSGLGLLKALNVVDTHEILVGNVYFKDCPATRGNNVGT